MAFLTGRSWLHSNILWLKDAECCSYHDYFLEHKIQDSTMWAFSAGNANTLYQEKMQFTDRWPSITYTTTWKGSPSSMSLSAVDPERQLNTIYALMIPSTVEIIQNAVKVPAIGVPGRAKNTIERCSLHQEQRNLAKEWAASVIRL